MQSKQTRATWSSCRGLCSRVSACAASVKPICAAPAATGCSIASPLNSAGLRHRLPAMYSEAIFVKTGGLAFYGIDRIDLYRRAVGYVDRILRGEKPAELPFQQPTK
jgi:ABC-type uncharacterized transport system substrate-binding protein